MKSHDLDKRIENALPERRKLVERLLRERKQQRHAERANPGVAVPESKMVKALHGARTKTGDSYGKLERGDYLNKTVIQNNYGAYHEELKESVFGDQSYFMNLGYIANESRQYSKVQMPPHARNSRFIQLALETIGDCDLAGRRVLDVGCGRGGTVYAMREYFEPAKVVGMDLTAEAVAFCSKTHVYANTSFLQGDAEHLPFDDASFDVVTNIESSHHYPHIGEFYTGVYRILSTGGYFLCATVLPVERFTQDLAFLSDMGFVLERNIDITANVLASCDRNKVELFKGVDSSGADEGIANAIGLPGSQIYMNMKSNVTAYRILHLRKAG